MCPRTQPWRPNGTHEHVNIADSQPRPATVRFMGRIVNFASSKEGPGQTRTVLPQGFHFLVVKDDTGVVAVSGLRNTSVM